MTYLKHRNRYWLIFLSVIALCVLGYTGYTAYKLFEYWKLSLRIPVSQIDWEVVPVTQEDFAVRASYYYQVEGKIYQGQSIWDEHYLNGSTAHEKADGFAKEQWKVWVNPSHPSQSALEKTFPLKQGLSAAVLWLILIYYLNLDSYVQKRINLGR